MELGDRQIQISENLEKVREKVRVACEKAGRSATEITLIAVTKTYPLSDVSALLHLGVHEFGENRSAEGEEKAKEIAGTWHFQGQMQSNKIKQIVQWANVIHSLDDLRHIPFIKKSLPDGKIISVFLQVALDENLHRGGAPEELLPVLAEKVLSTQGLQLEGLMAVAPLDQDPHRGFSQLERIHSEFSQQFPMSKNLSAGMSNDFEVAIQYGATHIRVGSSILGDRTSPL